MGGKFSEKYGDIDMSGVDAQFPGSYGLTVDDEGFVVYEGTGGYVSSACGKEKVKESNVACVVGFATQTVICDDFECVQTATGDVSGNPQIDTKRLL